MQEVYRTIIQRTWTAGSFTRLSRPAASGQFLWLYLLSGPFSSPVPGLIPAGKAALAEALGWAEEDFLSCFAELEREGMARADWTARLVWLPSAPAHNAPRNPNQLIYWGREFRAVPDSALKAEAWRAYRDLSATLGKGFPAAFKQSFGQEPDAEPGTAPEPPEPPKPPKPPKAPKPPKPPKPPKADPVHDVLTAIGDDYAEAVGAPFPAYGQAAAGIKAMLKGGMEGAEIVSLWRRYLLEPEPFYADRTWGKFPGWIARERTGRTAAPKKRLSPSVHDRAALSEAVRRQAEEEKARRPAAPPRPAIPKEGIEAFLRWEKAIRAEVSKTSFEMLVAPLTIAAWDGATLTLRAPHALHSERLRDLNEPISRAASAAGITVAFTTDDKEKEDVA